MVGKNEHTKFHLHTKPMKKNGILIQDKLGANVIRVQDVYLYIFIIRIHKKNKNHGTLDVT